MEADQLFRIGYRRFPSKNPTIVQKLIPPVPLPLQSKAIKPSDFTALEELFDSADSALFRAVLTIPEHVLHPLLPPRKKTGYNLRKRSHGLMLP